MDERKELAMLVQKDISAEFGKKKPPEGPLAERIADHIIAAGYQKREKVVFTSDFRMAFGQATDHPTGTGYRKLAPAQSVGQSAAQGVGWQTVARAICAETCAFKGEPACYEVTGNMGEPLPWPAPACDEPGCEWLAKRVLSALPKGQEHG